MPGPAARLADLTSRAKGCRRCPGVAPGSAVLGPRNGPVPAGLLFVAEAPGAPLAPPIISTGAPPRRHFDRSEASGEIRLATAAGRMPEPVASTVRGPDFSPSTSLRAGYSAPD